ncbi:hypothetical protein VOLCADRAFT_89060 [Volvox carteri f. nagariensis]|uniref:Uncharacterized protein n=1 Tax=Volvox carteri f. nagariensis TaxID=3068 RepID=D8TQP5_VOLCA|nr:uncharacterized protein VOLCADRAFT_89060 [Volvox carteri f. nagariensis]EFJ50072.1 hypothetical protein VOLCADRAFT_89060 [Volvox carteri f. nagariensis]|eukprot:XP_002948692.1 hypothetical protein VOLCADRAFT_89060 [Volvox carteri f. nagariensis]
MLGSAGNIMLGMLSAPDAPQSLQDRTAEEVLRRARIAHGSRMATLAHVNRVVDERSTSRQQRTSLIRMQYDRRGPAFSVFDDTAHAYAEVSAYADLDSLGHSSPSDGAASSEDDEKTEEGDSSQPRTSADTLASCTSRKDSCDCERGQDRPPPASSMPAANAASSRSSSRRILPAGIPSLNLADIKPAADDELVSEDLFAKCIVRLRSATAEVGSSGGSGSNRSGNGNGSSESGNGNGNSGNGSASAGHSQLSAGAPTAPAAAWVDEESSPPQTSGGGGGGGGDFSSSAQNTSPWDCETATSFSLTLPSHINDAWVRAAMSPQPGSALANLLANSASSSWRLRAKRVSAPSGAGLPLLRASCPGPVAAGPGDGSGETAAAAAAASGAGGGLPPRSGPAATISSRSALHGTGSTGAPATPPVRSSALTSELSNGALWGAPGVPRPQVFAAPQAPMADLSPASTASSFVSPPQPPLGPQHQGGQQQAAATVLPPPPPPLPLQSRNSRDRIPSTPLPATTLPYITTPIAATSAAGIRSRSASPAPLTASGASPNRTSVQEHNSMAGGVAAVWRVAAPAVLRDPRVVTPGGRRSVAGAAASNGVLSSSWSGSPGHLRPCNSTGRGSTITVSAASTPPAVFATGEHAPVSCGSKGGGGDSSAGGGCGGDTKPRAAPEAPQPQQYPQQHEVSPGCRTAQHQQQEAIRQESSRVPKRPAVAAATTTAMSTSAQSVSPAGLLAYGRLNGTGGFPPYPSPPPPPPHPQYQAGMLGGGRPRS